MLKLLPNQTLSTAQRWVVHLMHLLFNIDDCGKQQQQQQHTEDGSKDDGDSSDAAADDDDLFEVTFAVPPLNLSIPYLQRELRYLELFKQQQ